MFNFTTALISALPDPSPTQPPGTGAVNTIMDWLFWGGLVTGIAGLIIAGAILTVNQQRGDGAQSASRIVFVLFGVTVISAASAVVGALAG